MRVINDRVTLDKGWTSFVTVHQIMIRYMLRFKLLTPDTMKVIVFNNEGVEVVTKCKEHGNAFTATARAPVGRSLLVLALRLEFRLGTCRTMLV